MSSSAELEKILSRETKKWEERDKLINDEIFVKLE